MTHQWEKSPYGHGVQRCKHCFATDAELSVLGELGKPCEHAPKQTTQPQIKYPGADTSKLRYEQLVAFVLGDEFDHTQPNTYLEKLRKRRPFDSSVIAYDLLAMIEERDAVVAAAMNWCDLHGPSTDRTSSAMKDVITAIAKFRGCQ